MSDANDAGLRERVAKAIAQADEQNGAGPYALRMTMGKYAVAGLYDEADAAIAVLRREIEELRRERDAWKNVYSRAGICMSCALGSPEPFGCTDCLNTGWSEGAPQDVHEAKSALVEAVKLIQSLVHMAGVKPSNELMAAASAFAAKHGAPK